MDECHHSMDRLVREYGIYKGLPFCRTGSFLDGFCLSGIEPDSLSPEDRERLAVLLSNIYGLLPDSINLTQYYIKVEGHQVAFRPRDNEVAAALVRRRAAFLNQTGLANTFLYHLFEARRDSASDLLDKGMLLKNLALSLFKADARDYVGRRLSVRDHFAHNLAVMENTRTTLDFALRDIASRYESLFIAQRLEAEGVARLLAFLLTLDHSYLTGAPVPVAEYDWDQVLGACDIDIVTRNRVDYLRFSGDVTRYARMVSVTKVLSDSVAPGLFVSDDQNPLCAGGNLVVMSRFKPMTAFQQASFFRGRTNELERQAVNLRGLLRGNEQLTETERRSLMSSSLRERMDELQTAADLDVRWGFANVQALVFDQDLSRLDHNTRVVNGALNRVGLGTVYERGGLPKSLEAFLPAGSGKHFRDIELNTTQFAAAGLVFKSSTGMVLAADLGDEECLYVFQSKDGSVYHYTPFINGRGLVLNIGPVRSGKTFLRTTLATHFGKYDGGILRLVDIDQGGEPVARCYGEDGAVFNVDVAGAGGFNLFSSCRGADDALFQAHLSQSIRNLVKLNDAADMREFTSAEQIELDAAIRAVLALPTDMQTLGSVAAHCSRDIQTKMARFVGQGVYARIFDAQVDAIGSVDKRVAAFNLLSLKDNKDVLPLVMNEIFYRIITTFEDPRYKTVPKFADFDEAHAFLGVPGVAKLISSRIRTWGKWRGGMGLTTQSPKELIDLPDWPVLRSAASTMIFTADPSIDAALYKEAFHLTDAEVSKIAKLRPREEAYIIQREINVSKVVKVRVEPEQYVINTSKPDETVMRDSNIAQFGFEKGVSRTVQDLGLVANA